MPRINITDMVACSAHLCPIQPYKVLDQTIPQVGSGILSALILQVFRINLVPSLLASLLRGATISTALFSFVTVSCIASSIHASWGDLPFIMFYETNPHFLYSPGGGHVSLARWAVSHTSYLPRGEPCILYIFWDTDCLYFTYTFEGAESLPRDPPSRSWLPSQSALALQVLIPLWCASHL